MANFNSSFTGADIEAKLTAIVTPALGGTDVQIQAAIDGLTVSRTWIEKVSIKGDFTISDAIEIPSYTHIDIQGSLTSTNILVGDVTLFKNADATNTNIIITGGTLTTTGEAASTCIKMTGVTSLSLDSVNISDTGSHGISLAGCNDFIITRCDIENCGDDGISTEYCYDGRITHNEVIGGANNVSGSSGIEIEDSSHDITVSDNILSELAGSTASAIHCITDSGGTGGIYNVVIANNIIRNVGGKGIGIVSSKAAKTIVSMSGGSGSGSVNVQCTAHGLVSTHDSMVIIENVDDAGLTNLNGKWIATYVDANNFTIPSTTATDASTFAGDGDVYFDALNCTIVGNSIDTCTAAGVLVTRSRNIASIANIISRTGTDGYATGTGSENCSVSSNAFYQIGDIGISLFTNDRMLVNGNIINECGYNQANDYGIQANTVTNSLIIGNIVNGFTEGTNYTRGINSLSGGTNTIVNNNLSTAAIVSGRRVTATAGDILRDNVGDVTRNSGSSGLIVTAATVAHGLETTPTNVKVTPKDTGVTDFYVTADATNLTINYSGGGTHDFWWEASHNEE